jgi:DNA modification methylase
MLSSNKEVILSLMGEFRNHLKDIFIWEKQAVSQIVEGRLAKGYEFVFLFGKDNSMTFDYRDFPHNKYVPNIKTWYKSESIPEHHATFPIELPKYFIKFFTKLGDTVLDPFLGSGTTAVAAKELGRKYIGVDISEKYCELSRGRISKKKTYKGLFDV